MPTVLLVLLTVFLVAALACGTVVYLPYARSPEKQWRDRVLRAEATARRCAAAERWELQRLRARRQTDEQTVRDRAFLAFLHTGSVDQLVAYPGIGPATVAKLRGAGYTTLAALQNAHIQIDGLGVKRLADIQQAIRHLTGEYQSRFTAGACPEARNLTAELNELAARFAEREDQGGARLRAAENFLARLKESAALARSINLIHYWRTDWGQIVPEAVLNAPLPDFDQALAAAEEETRAQRARQKAPVPPRPEIAKRFMSPTRTHSPGRPKFVPFVLPVDQPVRAPTPPPAPPPAEEQPYAVLELTVQFLFALARADGSIARKEREVIADYIRETYGADAAQLNRANALCAHYETAKIDTDRCLQEIAQLTDRGRRADLLGLAGRIAAACGDINQREARFLERVADAWGLPLAPPTPPPAKESPPPANNQPKAPPARSEMLSALEIDPATPLSADLVRRQYHLLSERYDPDKLQAVGPEFVAMAEGKRAAVRAAAEALLKELGAPLEVEAAPAPRDLRENPDLDAMFGV